MNKGHFRAVLILSSFLVTTTAMNLVSASSFSLASHNIRQSDPTRIPPKVCTRRRPPGPTLADIRPAFHRFERHPGRRRAAVKTTSWHRDHYGYVPSCMTTSDATAGHVASPRNPYPHSRQVNSPPLHTN